MAEEKNQAGPHQDRNDRQTVLRMENITKAFGPLVANDSIHLTLKKNEILAIIGENGAGKTTLMKILYGLEQANEGKIYINEKEVSIRNAADAIALGIGMVQQHFMLFDPFTVAENIVYSREPRRGPVFDLESAARVVKDLSRETELPLDPNAKIEGMPVGLRQRVEIFKVLYQNAKIIIFDEPSAVLTPQETRELLKTIKKLAASGKSIIIITHKLNEVMEIADRAVVLRAGKEVANVSVADTSIEELSYFMVARTLNQNPIAHTRPKADILVVNELSIQGLSVKPILDRISLHVAGGEIVGIAGVSGNGQSEFISALFGLRKIDSGEILVKGESIVNHDVKAIRDAGVSLIPEDRNIWGIARQAKISESAIMGHQEKTDFSRRGILNIRAIRNFALNIVQQYKVKTDNIALRTSSLSGGNAQKLIVAREISQNTPLLIAAEPTRGIDIGAMEFIHEKLIEKRNHGDAILLISSELSEIMKLSDRIYVIFEGKINGEFQHGNVTEEELGYLMVGGEKKYE